MEVILLERVGKLGTVGDVVKVKDGYGRNYLLPQKKALRANRDNKAIFEARRAEIEAKNAESRAAAEARAAKLGAISAVLVRQASEDGKLYGSVSVRDVVEQLETQGHAFERTQVLLTATIKHLGSATAKLVLHPEVILTLPIHVVRNANDVKEAATLAEEKQSA